MSVCDALFGLTFLIADFRGLLSNNPHMDTTFITITDVVIWVFVTSEILHALLIAVERILTLKFPQKNFLETVKKSCIAIMIVWLLSISIPLLWRFEFGCRAVDCQTEKAGFLTLGIVLVICAYATLTVILCKIGQSIDQQANDNTQSRQLIQRCTIVCLLIGLSNVLKLRS